MLSTKVSVSENGHGQIYTVTSENHNVAARSLNLKIKTAQTRKGKLCAMA